jgi:hypothetical protein
MIFEKLGDRAAARNYLYRALSLNPHFHPRYAQVAAGKLNELSERAPSAKEPPDDF